MAKRILIFLFILFLFVLIQDSGSNSTKPLSRQEILAIAERIAQHTWICRAENRVAPCVSAAPYKSDWQVNQKVTGIPYDWGGMDGPEEYDRKLAQGKAAGSHSRHGITDCTAGIDCSGFVSRCWGMSRILEKYSTRDIREKIGARPRYNWYADMQPGDALVKPGSHIVLFVRYRADGNPTVYEASGAAGKVILNERCTWSTWQGYYPLEYRSVVKE